MTKLIAIGNRFMKDDAVGIKAAESLKEKIEDLGIELIFGEAKQSSAFDLINEDDFVIVLDSVLSEREPGNVYVINLSEALSVYKPASIIHDMSVFDYMLQSKKAFEGYFIGIEASEISFGEELSNILSERFSEICDNVYQAVFELLRGRQQ